MAAEGLRESPMMAHLLDALDDGQDVGHYGRLVFAMVARYFMDEDQVVGYLTKSPGVDEKEARALWLQVTERDYSPPSQRQVLAWQREQDFPICPDADDPNACNVYKELRFPSDVYEHISDFYEERAEAEMDNH